MPHPYELRMCHLCELRLIIYELRLTIDEIRLTFMSFTLFLFT